MTTQEAYDLHKAQMFDVLEILLDAARESLAKQGGFLPFGLVLPSGERPRMVMAAGPNPEWTNAPEVLPDLLEAMRAAVAREPIEAVAVAENVFITPEGAAQTAAIKVQYEHRDGFSVAFYAPFRKEFGDGYVIGDVIARPAAPEIIQTWERK